MWRVWQTEGIIYLGFRLRRLPLCGTLVVASFAERAEASVEEPPAEGAFESYGRRALAGVYAAWLLALGRDPAPVKRSLTAYDQLKINRTHQLGALPSIRSRRALSQKSRRSHPGRDGALAQGS